MRDFSEQDIRHSRRKAALKRKRKKRAVFVSAMVALTMVLTVWIFFFVNQSENRKEILQLQGIWQYDEYIKYEFDDTGNGCMYLEDLHYEYAYTVKNNTLKLDFKDDSVRDCTYTFSIKDATLTISGGEGTIGGTYELHKQI